MVALFHSLFLGAMSFELRNQHWNIYSQYTKQVRQEYSIYSDVIYNAGRKKVLNHFLTMNRIFKTPYFFDKLEKQAKENLFKELESL